MKRLIYAMALMLPLTAGATDIETIEAEWGTKVIRDVPTAGLGIMLERFDMTWPTTAVGDVCQVMQTGVAKKVLDSNDGYTVEVDAKNGYVESYTEGSDRQTMSACIWRRTNGHRLFAVVISQPTDPETEVACFYDYDPQQHILTPEPDIVDNIRPLFPTAYMNFVLPKTGKDLIVSEYSSGYTYNRIYKWDGMLPVYDRTEKEALDVEDTSPMDGGGPDMSFPVRFSGTQPTISDFITAITSQEELCESMNHVVHNWNNCRNGRPLGKGATLSVDERNGYCRHEKAYAPNEKAYVEFCYWNCKDGKHKLIAQNTGHDMDNKPIETECTGLTFYLYDNEKRTLTYASPYDVGASIQVTPAVTYSLPRQGKDIQAYIHDPKRVVKILMRWNGQKFDQEQIK